MAVSTQDSVCHRQSVTPPFPTSRASLTLGKGRSLEVFGVALELCEVRRRSGGVGGGVGCSATEPHGANLLAFWCTLLHERQGGGAEEQIAMMSSLSSKSRPRAAAQKLQAAYKDVVLMQW